MNDALPPRGLSLSTATLCVAAALLVVAVLLIAGWLGHGVATGIGVPYQDATPEQAEYERYHMSISMIILAVTAAVWLVFAVAAVLFAIKYIAVQQLTGWQ